MFNHPQFQIPASVQHVEYGAAIASGAQANVRDLYI
jgi:hypothetical protein